MSAKSFTATISWCSKPRVGHWRGSERTRDYSVDYPVDYPIDYPAGYSVRSASCLPMSTVAPADRTPASDAGNGIVRYRCCLTASNLEVTGLSSRRAIFSLAEFQVRSEERRVGS